MVQQSFPVGVSYYPLDDERLSWSDWYAADPEPDFARMAENGIGLARVFVSWHCLEPQVGLYDEEAAGRLDRVVAAAKAHGVRLLVTFFADDRLAELAEVPWGRKRDPRTDGYLVQREAALVQRIVSRYRTEPAITGWELANEAFCAGFADGDALLKWTRALREAVREVDPDRPVTLPVDPETLFRERRVDARPALDLGEHTVSHATSAYRAYAAPGPLDGGAPTYLDSFLLRVARRSLPVLLDAVGPTSLEHSPAEEAAYVRTALYGGLMNGAAGVLLRRWRDLCTERREPYFEDPHEELVGVVDGDGAPKPALDEARRFARVAARLDLRRYRPAPERVAVLLPAERYAPPPSLAALFDPRSCLQAYVCAKEAHLPVDIVREGEPLAACAALVVPSAVSLTDATWVRLAAFVQAGGSMVLSYGGGDPHPAMRELFGVEFQGDGGRRGALSCRVAQQGLLGELAGFDAPLETPHFALLGQGGATIVATDERGSPLLTLNAYGTGRAVLVAAPVERALAQGDPVAAPLAVRAMMRAVYGAVAEAAGAGPAVGCDLPEVEVALLQGEEDDVLLALNHAPEKVVATFTAPRRVVSVADVRGGPAAEVGEASFGVPLGPNGATALRLRYRREE